MTRTLASMIRELTEPSKQQTKTPDGRVVWRVSAPSLLDQLSSLEPSSSEGVRRGFGSRPPAQIEAIDLAKAIDSGTRLWLRTLGDTGRGTGADVVRRLYSLTPPLDRGTVDEITSDVRRWYTSARVVSGWDSAPFRPANRCPHCEEYGSLRVNVADRLACCIECRAAWDSSTLGILAEHIRAENGEDDTPSEAA
jgi:hypothetical protein